MTINSIMRENIKADFVSSQSTLCIYHVQKMFIYIDKEHIVLQNIIYIYIYIELIEYIA